MRCEVLAIGTELLLGDVIDTNSSWIAQRLAASGIDCLQQTKVGDNQTRIVTAMREALQRSDALICCGGLGPTQDDITRECIAELAGQPLESDPAMEAEIAQMFASRGREMPGTNLRQAQRPSGASFLHNDRGTAPGLCCTVHIDGSDKVVYAVPGVPHEMQAMVDRDVLSDLRRRSGSSAVIGSRVLRTWGMSEAAVAETVAPCLDALDLPGAAPATIAFLASGIEGIKVRVTAKASSTVELTTILDQQEAELRQLLGPVVFGVDDVTMERAVGTLLADRSWSLGVAESVTGGMMAARIVGVAGASQWFRGGVVSYASEVKFSVLGVDRGPVVSALAARQMAEGATSALGAEVGLSTTGVAGPDEQDGMPVGTVFVGVVVPGSVPEVVELHVPGDRERIRQYASISALNILRQRLLDLRREGK